MFSLWRAPVDETEALQFMQVAPGITFVSPSEMLGPVFQVL